MRHAYNTEIIIDRLSAAAACTRPLTRTRDLFLTFTCVGMISHFFIASLFWPLKLKGASAITTVVIIVVMFEHRTRDDELACGYYNNIHVALIENNSGALRGWTPYSFAYIFNFLKIPRHCHQKFLINYILNNCVYRAM